MLLFRVVVAVELKDELEERLLRFPYWLDRSVVADALNILASVSKPAVATFKFLLLETSASLSSIC